MKELQLKYGMNPNQKPARIYMADGSDLPVTVLNGKPGYINFLDALNSIQLVMQLKESCKMRLSMFRPPVQPWACPLPRWSAECIMLTPRCSSPRWPMPMPAPAVPTV